jgi:NAD(P)-dependent dehydrogenase (short-subunit alcohol dehydrogenase family)
MGDARRVLIAGASRGIGAALAIELASRGYALVLTWRTGEREAQAVAQRCNEFGGPPAVVHRLDLLDDASIRDFAAEVSAFDILVLNAAVIDWTPFDRASSEGIESVLRSNVEGPLKLTVALFDKIGDSIVAVGSDVALDPHPGLVVYSASKAALRAAALALAKGRAHPRILIVHPTRTATGMNAFEGRDPADVARAIADAIDRRAELPSGAEIAV